MKKEIVKKITAFLLIVALTMVNFALLGVEMVSYAADALSTGTATNNKNVTFDAYFKNENGAVTFSKEESMSSNDLKLFMQVSVKRDGYFNGYISLKDTNFKFKTEVSSDAINKIEENAITLNKIDAGETAEFEVGIEPIKSDNISSGLLNMESNISINGIYRNSEEKDINIEATRAVQLTLTNPYTDSEGMELTSTIITNGIYQIDGTNKRMVQVLVESGLKNNLYPIKETSIELNVPNGTEAVEVTQRGISITNGKPETAFNTNNWTYSEKDKNVKITISNIEENGTINWVKNGKDRIVVTYIINPEISLTDTNIETKGTITMYDTVATTKEANVSTKVLENKDGIIQTGVSTAEASIYKGKIYSGENRDYKVTTDIYINSAKTAKTASINLMPAAYETEKGEIIANAQYTNTTINKSDVIRILGENGSLKITTIDGTILSQITKDTQADENENIVINYEEGITALNVETTVPEQAGTIILNSTKTIKQDENSREIKRTYATLKEAVTGAETKISLQETNTIAKIETNRASLSTMVENTGVEISAILKTNSEEDDLYSNPTIKIVMPSQVEELTVNSLNLLYEDELQIGTTNVSEENGTKVIEINLIGEQTKHKFGEIEGATLIINANLTLNKKATSSEEAIKMVCTNPNAKTEINASKNIQVISPRGLVTINSIEDFGMSVVGEEETQTSKLELNSNEKQSQVNIEVINNNEDTISDVKVLGNFPTRSDVNTINTTVSSLEVSGADATVYYTENENATDNINESSNGWTTNINSNSDVKKYLISVNSMDNAQELTASYNLNIPAGLQYNEEAYEGYKVTYNDSNTTNEIAATTLGLSTGKGPEINTTIKAKLGNTDISNGAEVAQGEVIRYEINVENTGTETATDVNISSIVPEGTVYVEPKINYEYEDGYYNEFASKKEVTFNIASISAGEKVTKAYDVKVTKNATVGAELTSKATVKYGEAMAESNIIKNTVKEGTLSVTVKRITDREIELYRDGSVTYYIMVENISNQIQKDVNTIINLPNELELSKVILIDNAYSQNPIVTEKETSKNVGLGDINPGETKYVCVVTTIKSLENQDIKDVSISATAKATGSNEVRSNTFEETIKDFKLNISLSANNENGYLKTNDIIEYTIKVQNTSKVDAKLVDITDTIPAQLSVLSVNIDGNTKEVQNNNIRFATDVGANSTVEAKVQAVVNYDEERVEPVVISNVATASDLGQTLATSKEVSHILQADSESAPGGGNISGNNLISGTAWLDENQNGQRENEEPLLDGINVKLIDTSGNIAKNMSGNDITATTNSKGFYIFSEVPQGQYLVVFDYDTSVYAVTAYQKEGVSDSKNSDAIVKQIAINGQEGLYGVTDTITMNEEGISNIDIGLISGTKFDLELNKYISKIVVQNSKGTKTYEYNKATLAKAEIAAKQLQGSTVIIEYQIEVKNAGQVAGYVKSIADYMPSSLKFNSELNTDWYQSGTTLYNASLANAKLEAGEVKTIPLVLTKTMTEENTGLVNNTAEIAESYNDSGLSDVDSTAGNRVNGEDDMGLADVIIGVKTGAMITYIGLTMTVLVLLGIGAYFINRKLNKNDEIEVDL